MLFRSTVGSFDASSLVYPWKNEDARLDALSDEGQALAADADSKKLSRSEAFTRIWNAAHAAAGISVPELQIATPRAPVPFLSEPWYCCAEPTQDQLVSIGSATKAKPRPQVPESVATPANGFV